MQLSQTTMASDTVRQHQTAGMQAIMSSGRLHVGHIPIDGNREVQRGDILSNGPRLQCLTRIGPQNITGETAGNQQNCSDAKQHPSDIKGLHAITLEPKVPFL
jgi:hypothetical protein